VSYSRRLWNCAGSPVSPAFYWGLQRHSAIVHTIYWLAKTHSIAEAPAGVPDVDSSDEQIQALQERREDFEQKISAGQPAEIELTADDINCLIAMRRAAVESFCIDGGESLAPPDECSARRILRLIRYFNGDITIQTNGAVSLEHPQLNTILVNNEPVPKNL
jgi:hypothetical protein